MLAASIVPSNLSTMCNASLQLIENATKQQIRAAIRYNQDEINRLLIKLVTINFISKNQAQIAKEIKQEEETRKNNNLQEYCERALLLISPKMGFWRRECF